MVQERRAISQPPRLALVGCGQIGRVHAERVMADGRATIVALCDADEQRAKSLQEALCPKASVHADLQRLLHDGKPRLPEPIDAAIVATPTHLHFDQVRELRAAGMALLCEKPLADTEARIDQLVRECQLGGPLLSIAYQRRYWSAYRTLRREVQSGRHGPVRSVTVQIAEPWQPTIAGTWRDDPQRNPGGFLGDAGSHKVDAVFFVTGLAPREVFAHSDRRGSRVEIVITISARLENDVALSMSFIGDAQHVCEDFHVHCARADLLFRDGVVWVARGQRVEKLEPLEPETNPDSAFFDCLLTGAPNVAPASVALPVWHFTQAALESAQSGRLIRLS
ncbi:MAG: Gfo/Idh/MocA family protein [Planctomycetaceae bacterium]